MAVTLRDIAQKVGKSVTTVSRALNDYDDVGPETKARVLQVAEELGYSPSTLAQRLRKKRAETLGLSLPTYGPRFSDPFFSEFIAGVGNKASQRGYDLLVSTHPPGDEESQAYHQSIRGRRVDGFLVVRTRRVDTRIDILREAGFPFVAFGRTEGELDFPFVDMDGTQGMQLVADHLLQLGHKRIAYISPPGELMFAHYRMKGLRETLAKAGIQLPSCQF